MRFDFVAILNLLFAVNLFAAPPDFRWVRHAGGSDLDYATIVVMDTAGNSYVMAKAFSSDAMFGSLALSNASYCVVKYDVDGTALWVRPILVAPALDQSNELIYRMDTDAGGNVYIGGSFSSASVQFGDVTLSKPNPDPYSWEIFIAKYDTDGGFQWARTAGGTNEQDDIRCEGFASDAGGNCYLAGDYYAADVLGLTNLAESYDNLGFYVAKFDPNGSNVWTRNFAQVTNSPITGPTYPLEIAHHTDGGFYISGVYSTLTMALGSVMLSNAAAAKTDIFTARYDAQGNVVWAKSGGGVGDDWVTGFALDAAGNTYLAGWNGGEAAYFDSRVITNLGSGGDFLVKYDADGNVNWCKRTGQFGNGNFPKGRVDRATADAAGNSYVSGWFWETATFDNITLTNSPWPVSPILPIEAFFLTKLDSDGRVLWAKSFAGSVNAERGYNWNRNRPDAGGLAVDSRGNGRIAGLFTETNSPFDGFLLSPSGYENLYVAAFDADPPRLEIATVGNSVILSWPTNQPDFVIEWSTNIWMNNCWSSVTDLVATADLRYYLTNPIAPDSRFFRLYKP